MLICNHHKDGTYTLSIHLYRPKVAKEMPCLSVIISIPASSRQLELGTTYYPAPVGRVAFRAADSRVVIR